MAEPLDLSKTIDELDLKAKMMRIFPKMKKQKEETEEQYERKFLRGY